MMNFPLLFWFAILLLTAGLAFLLAPLARKITLVDHPGGHKIHKAPIPLIGGPVIYLALIFALAMIQDPGTFIRAVLTGGTLMLVTGLIDDRFGLSVLIRFVVQIIACVIVIYMTGIYLLDFGQLFTPSILGLGPLAIPITIFAALGVINAYNLIDGLDGLSGSVFIVAATGMYLLANRADQVEIVMLLEISIPAVLGFLLLNARFPWNQRARVFLGDSGSLFLGFLLAWCFIAMGSDTPEGQVRAFMPMTAVWLIALPLLDTSTSMWRRWRRGASAMEPDQEHLHHAFQRAGFSVRATWICMTFWSALLAAIGLSFEFLGVKSYVSFWLFMAVSFLYFHYVSYAWKQQKFLGRDFIRKEFSDKNGLQ